MNKILKYSLLGIIIFIFLVFFSIILYPIIFHFDCYTGGGKWRGLSTTGVDYCWTKGMGGEAITAGCDCGPDKCWDGNKCVYDEQKSVYSEKENYGRFELPEEDGECKTDSECFIGGCSGEKCTTSQRIGTTCEIPEGMINSLYCKCINEKCIWIR